MTFFERGICQTPADSNYIFVQEFLRASDDYSSPNFIRVITWKAMSWAEHVAQFGEMRNSYEINHKTLRNERTLNKKVYVGRQR
jgi:hypothetical protein